MAAYDLEEQEQLAEIKAWWKQYGNLVTGLVTAAALGVIAWQGWNWYQGRQAAQASGVYAVLQKAVLDKDLQRIKTSSGELLAKYGSSTYAPLGALTAAKALFDAGDLKTAKVQLGWVADNAKDELRELGRLRLAAVLLDEKAYDEALRILDAKPAPGFAARFSELRGDVLAAQGKRDEARAAYRAALSALEANDLAAAGSKSRSTLQDKEANAPYREMLQQRLDALGGAQ